MIAMFFNRTVRTTKGTAPYLECKSHWKCLVGHFCAVKCFTGGCGENGAVPAGTPGLFCQPCDKCVKAIDSKVRGCAVCQKLVKGDSTVRFLSLVHVFLVTVDA